MINIKLQRFIWDKYFETNRGATLFFSVLSPLQITWIPSPYKAMLKWDRSSTDVSDLQLPARCFMPIAHDTANITNPRNFFSAIKHWPWFFYREKWFIQLTMDIIKVAKYGIQNAEPILHITFSLVISITSLLKLQRGLCSLTITMVIK